MPQVIDCRQQPGTRAALWLQALGLPLPLVGGKQARLACRQPDQWGSNSYSCLQEPHNSEALCRCVQSQVWR